MVIRALSTLRSRKRLQQVTSLAAMSGPEYADLVTRNRSAPSSMSTEEGAKFATPTHGTLLRCGSQRTTSRDVCAARYVVDRG